MQTKTKIDLQPAYMLHMRAYRDTSAIVDFFTPEYGRVAAVARGVKSAKSKWRGTLQPFQPLLLSWYGRTDLMTLTQAESVDSYRFLQGMCLSCGFYINELIMKLVPRMESQIEIFAAYQKMLRTLTRLSEEQPSFRWQLQAELRYFELDLLKGLGYGLTLDREALSGIPVKESLEYSYIADSGAVAVHEDAPHYELDSEVHMHLSGATLLALHARSLPQDSSAANADIYSEAKRFTRMVLDRYLGYKPLNSRRLLQGAILPAKIVDESESPESPT